MLVSKEGKAVKHPDASLNVSTPRTKKKNARVGKLQLGCQSGDDKIKKLLEKVMHSQTAVSSNWLAFNSSKGLTVQGSGIIDSNPKGSNKKLSQKTCSASTPSSVNASRTTDNKYTKTCPETSKLSTMHQKSKAEKKMLAQCVALDCEMVGVYDGSESVLARVSIVNHDGNCIYDKFVKPKEDVVDYRTFVSGVRPSDLRNGEEFEVVQKEVASILKGKILVGHALKNDFKVLLLSHPPTMVRDTSSFKLFREISNGRNPSLKKLAAEILGITIQAGEHSSVEDAKAAMQLYNLYQKEWESLRLKKKALRKDATSKVPQLKGSSQTTNFEFTKEMLMDEFTAF